MRDIEVSIVENSPVPDLWRDHVTANLPYAARYMVIGAIVFVIDVSSFQVLLRLQAILPVAITGSFLASLCTHFTLNRLWNFRNFDRSGFAQFRTYLIVVSLQYVLSLISIEAAVHFGAPPLVAKVGSALLNFPVGFIGHRYLTFGDGAGALLKRLASRFSR